MLKLFTKIFGSKSERDLKPLWPYVEQINAAFEQLKDLSNDALRSKTLALKEHIQRQLQPIVDARDTIDKEAEETTSTDIDKKEQLYEGVDKLKQQYNQRLEEVLMDILPQAFAIVKETARRFKAHKQLMVTATAQDQILAASTDYVTMQGDQAIWHNQWEAADNPVVWDMLHYDVQLIGGIILHQGKIA
jgi:preprotein translocase subunit SecA